MKQDWVDVNTSKAAPEAVAMIYYFSALTDGGVYYVSDTQKLILCTCSLTRIGFEQLPKVNCKSIVQKVFRGQDPSPNQTKPEFLEKADKLDLATAFIRVLEGNIAKVRCCSIHHPPQTRHDLT